MRFAATAKTTLLLGMAAGVPTMASAGLFTDNFASGLNSFHWNLTESAQDLYSYDGSHGDVRFAKVGTSPGGLQYIQAALDMAHVGGPVSGEFSAEIDARDIMVAGPSTNQVHLGVGFGSYAFYLVFSNEAGHNNVHVWDGGYRTGFNTNLLAGTMRVSRVGSFLAAYFEDQYVWGTNYSGDVSDVVFNLMNNHSNDPISVTFDDFSLEGDGVVPEPTALAAMGLGLALLVARRRR